MEADRLMRYNWDMCKALHSDFKKICCTPKGRWNPGLERSHMKGNLQIKILGF